MRSRFSIAALVAAFFVSPVSAQNICGPRDEIVARLNTAYAEVLRAEALTVNGHMIEVYVSVNGSWTVLLTAPGAQSCVVGAGEHWQFIGQEKGKGT